MVTGHACHCTIPSSNFITNQPWEINLMLFIGLFRRPLINHDHRARFYYLGSCDISHCTSINELMVIRKVLAPIKVNASTAIGHI